MIKKHRCFYISLFFFVYLSLYLQGQSYLGRYYTEDDGLPSSAVEDVVQDQLGRMWFAGRGGITLYDGIHWHNFTPEHGLPVRPFLKLRIDRSGTVWGLSDFGGNSSLYISYLEAAHETPPVPGFRWQTFPGLQFSAKKGRVITGFELLERPGQPHPTILVATEKNGLFVIEKNRKQQLTQAAGLPDAAINGLAVVGQDIYAATDMGLAVIRIAPGGEVTVDNRMDRELPRPPGELKGIAVQWKDRFPGGGTKETRIWLFGMTWLGWFPAGGGEFTAYTDDPGMNKKIRSGKVVVCPDYRSGVYVGTNNELKYYNYNIGLWETVGIASGLPARAANGIFIDFEKNMWFATDRGVGKISSRRFASFQQHHGMLEDEVASIMEYEPGKFVLGQNLGITLYTNGEFRAIPFPREKKTYRGAITRVLDMSKDVQGNIWMALSWAGVAKLNPTGPAITWFDKANGLPLFVNCVFADRDGSIWAGGNTSLFRLAPGKKLFEKVPIPVTKKFSVRKMFGSNGKLTAIASSTRGVYLYDRQLHKWTNHKVEGSPRSNSVYALYEDAEARWLVGTARGAFVLEDTGKGMHFESIDHLGNRPVYFIMRDRHKRYWFGTDNGVVRRDNNTGKVDRFTTAQGLVGQETNRAAGIMDHNGRIWIGTNRGVSVYDEAFDNTMQFRPKPKLHLMHMEIPGTGKVIPMADEKAVELSAGENTLAFHFRGVSFGNETAIRFRSRLQGFEDNWSTEYYPYGQMVRYTNLSAGKYRFRLKVRNADGIWSDEVASPEIVILRPFYSRWWFFTLVFLAVAGSLYFVSKFFAERKHSALLEQQVAERTRQLEETQQQLLQAQKMEAIGTLAGGIAHDFNNILGVITGYSELLCEDLPEGGLEHHNANEVLKAARRAADLVRQILAFSRKSARKHVTLRLTPVIQESMKMLRATIPATIDIRQNYNALNDTVKADPTQMHQVIINLVTNSAHAMKDKGGLMEVSLDETYLENTDIKDLQNLTTGNYLKLTIRDTGHGIPKVVLKRIFDPYFTTKETGEGTGLGLSMIHGIVKNHGGDVTVKSKPAKGTTFSVYLPLI